ncbi:hypothetical protein CP082626L3_0057B, partial [Chlamydia psittaci 08-2626_L3]
SFVLI